MVIEKSRKRQYHIAVATKYIFRGDKMTIYFGENLKKLRKEKDMTQEALADFLGISFQAVSKWERGETYPDITMLPTLAAFFGVSVDVLLGVSTAKREEEIKELLEFYNQMHLKDSPLTFERFRKAAHEYPEDFRIVIRYMELLMGQKGAYDCPGYEKASEELMTLYGRINTCCTDDSIRMWAKRLICQHLHSKAYRTGKEEYQLKAEEILSEMPELVNSREYLSTMLISDPKKQFTACSEAIEQELYIMQGSVSHLCFYEDRFTAEEKIRAIEKMLMVIDTVYTDGDYGKMWCHLIYNYGHLGYLYAQLGNGEKAIENLRLSAGYAREYDALPEETTRTSMFFRGQTYRKLSRGKTMCERMKILMTERYPLREEFKATEGFRAVISVLEGK